jgi:CHAT domain-containing protein
MKQHILSCTKWFAKFITFRKCLLISLFVFIASSPVLPLFRETNVFLLSFSVLAEESSDKFLRKKAETLVDKGNELNFIDPKLSLEPLSEALSIYQRLNDRSAQKDALHSLGTAYLFLQQHRKSIEYNQSALKIVQSAQAYEGQISEQINIMQSIASSYMYLGDDDKSIKTNLELLKLAQERDDSLDEQIATLVVLGEIYTRNKNYQTAEHYLGKASELSRNYNNYVDESILSTIGELFSQTGRMEEAERAIANAFQIQELKTVQIDRFIYESLAPYNNFINNKNSLSKQDASEYFRMQAKSLYLIKLIKSDELLPYCNQYQKILITRHKFSEALVTSERCRARALSDLMLSQSSPNQSLYRTSPSIKEIQNVARERKVTFVEYSLLYDDKILNQKLIRQTTQLLIWVVQPNGEISFRKVDLRTLGNDLNFLPKLIANSRESMGVRGRASIKVQPINTNSDPQSDQTQKLQLLYQILIQPISDLLPKHPEAQVVFIPNESLFLTPFPALQDSRGKYLIENNTILTAPSIQVVDLVYRRPKQNSTLLEPKVLIVGNPTMPKHPSLSGSTTEILPVLPGAELEAKAIAAMLKTQAITGDQASKAAVISRISQAKIIHLATHGLIDGIRQPQDDYFLDFIRFMGLFNSKAKPDQLNLSIPGAIALAPSGKDNGLLTSDEISKIKLTADLVVLSACNTGQGQILADGALGLYQAFLAAGARSVVASLWSVPDSPTAELMTIFYHNWRERKLNKVQALRQAMLMTMRKHRNPRDWAAFTLMGEAE